MIDVREKRSSQKRLIDANALIAEYDRVHIGEPGKARKLIEDAPAVDAVEVVRCKDCKYMTQWAYGRYCTVWDGVNGMGDDGFCNYGERKGGDNND